MMSKKKRPALPKRLHTPLFPSSYKRCIALRFYVTMHGEVLPPSVAQTFAEAGTKFAYSINVIPREVKP